MHHTQDTAKKKKEHWGKLQETIDQIPKRHMAIGLADANGQVGPHETQQENMPKSSDHTNTQPKWNQETAWP